MKGKLIVISAVFLLLSGAGKAFGQGRDLLESLYERMTSSCVETAYTYTTEVSGVKINGSHSLELQDRLWHMKGNGIEIWCDGKTVWTTDPVAKEVIIEDAADDENGDLTNPALLLVRLDEWFDVKEKRQLPDGKNMLYILAPKHGQEMGIEFFNIKIRKSDGMVSGGSFALEDGTTVSLNFTSMAMKQEKPVTHYRPSVTFDTSWIITDLR